MKNALWIQLQSLPNAAMAALLVVLTDLKSYDWHNRVFGVWLRQIVATHRYSGGLNVGCIHFLVTAAAAMLLLQVLCGNNIAALVLCLL